MGKRTERWHPEMPFNGLAGVIPVLVKKTAAAWMAVRDTGARDVKSPSIYVSSP